MKQNEMLLILFFYLFLIVLGYLGPRLGKSFYVFRSLQDAGITSISWKARPNVYRIHVVVMRALPSRIKPTPRGIGSVLDIEKKQALGKSILEDSKKTESLKELPKG
jgi:hypothetical protein